jgi:dsDNA-specific endonuclease/ATPase MutS2
VLGLGKDRDMCDCCDGYAAAAESLDMGNQNLLEKIEELRAQLAKNEEVLRSAERLSKWNHNNLVNLNFTELNILSSELSDLSDAVRAAKEAQYETPRL